MTAIAAEPTTLKLTVSREALAAAVAAVAPALARTSRIPVLSTLHLSAESGHLSVTATDFDHWVTRRVPAEVAEEGVALVSADSLSRLVKALPPDPVALGSGKKAHTLTLKCGAVRSTLAGMAPDEYPAQPSALSEGFATAGRLLVSQLRELAERTTYAVANSDETGVHGPLAGVLCELRADRMRLVGANRHRMALADAAVTLGADVGDAIVTRGTLEHVFRCFADDAEIEVARGEFGIAFRGDSGLVAASLIGGPFPPYRNMLAKSSERSVVVDRVVLLAALRRTMAVTVKLVTPRVVLDVKADRLALSATGNDGESVDDAVACTLTGAPTRFGADASYLIEALQHMPSDNVRFELRKPTNEITMRPHDWAGGECVAVIAPLRLD